MTLFADGITFKATTLAQLVITTVLFGRRLMVIKSAVNVRETGK